MIAPPGGTERRDARARLALDGLSVGDAFGERFFGPPGEVAARIEARLPAPPPWPWTDDTATALPIVDSLRDHGRLDADALATVFAVRFVEQPWPG